MPVEFVTDHARLAALKSAWGELASKSSWPNVFYEPWYILSAIQCFELDMSHGFVHCDREPDRLIGYIPLKLGVKNGVGRPSILENWHHDYCFSGQPLIAAGRELDFWKVLLKHFDQTPRIGSTIRFRSIKGSGKSYNALCDVLKEDNRWHREYKSYSRAILFHNLNADEYLKTHLTKKKRKEHRRQRRRLEEVGELREQTLSANGDIDDWIDEFLRLEKSGWKGVEETALDSDISSAVFFRDICRSAFSADRLSMLKLSLDGVPVAMMVTFLAKPAGNFTFKIAYEESLSKYSPGVLLELAYLNQQLEGEIDGEGWSDSCAAEDHPMINKIWRDRLQLSSFKISPKRPIARLASIYDDGLSRLLAAFKN